jgi:hypothetical protein
MCLRRSEGKKYLRRGAGFSGGAAILQQPGYAGQIGIKK